MKKPIPRGRALLPILVFLIIYIGCGIYYEYINPIEGGQGFYVMPVVVAFMIALVVAFCQNRELKFQQKISVCAKGLGDSNIVTMLFVFLLAGGFSGIASAAGGASSTANLLLNFIPLDFFLPGMFVIACLISISMGTSCGTISVLVPIVFSVATSADLNLPLCVGTVIGGAMFGDNLSFISDTTIAATKTQGVEMKDKFRENIKVALPAAVITLIILVAISIGKIDTGNIAIGDYNIAQVIPYLLVLVAGIIGINVFIVLGAGIAMFAVIGVVTGTLDLSTIFTSLGTGTSGMFETMIVTILVAAIGALMKEYGGFEAILEFIRKHFKGKIGGKFGIGILTSLMDISTANNTVAIVLAGPIAKDISAEYDIKPTKVASLLDTFSCITQGIIPYGAQLLIAAGIVGISSLDIIQFLIYPFILLVCVIINILISKK